MPSAWESDEGPHEPCVVCGGRPDRVVDLPRLPDVHVAFASSALCAACADVAHGGDVAALTARAGERWADDPDAVLPLVRLVLAWAGHTPPPAARAPESDRHRTVTPLDPADRRIWRDLEPLMYDGPPGPVRVRGRIVDEEDGSVVDVVRDGDRMRLSDGDGRPWRITDGVTSWSRRDGDRMVSSPFGGNSWGGLGSLAGRRSRDEIEVFGFGTPLPPLEPTVYLDRPAWRFRFAAPAHKPYDMHVVVDGETGLVLEERFGDHVTRWTRFETGGAVDDDAFTWTGPVVTAADLRAADEAEHEADMRERARWFAEHVTAESLVVAGERTEVTLHMWDDDGSFHASFFGPVDGAVSRRRRSDEWWDVGSSAVTQRWSDERWDWALDLWDAFDDGPPDDAVVAVVRAWLSS